MGFKALVYKRFWFACAYFISIEIVLIDLIINMFYDWTWTLWTFDILEISIYLNVTFSRNLYCDIDM